MDNRDFAAWCAAATEMIRYGPDRKTVSAELQAHLEDKYDSLIANGVPVEDAAAQALEAMGSAAEIAPQLGAIHRPWLGYLYSIVRFLGISTGIVAGFLCGVLLWHQLNTWINNEIYESFAVHSETGYYCQPDISMTVDGYRICIPEVAVDPEGQRLLFILQVSWCPWGDPFMAREHFWAVDSLGNYYEPIAAWAYEDPTRVVSNSSMSTSGFVENRMSLIGFGCDAQWVEICYDRDGRNIVFHIDLTGGDTHG